MVLAADDHPIMLVTRLPDREQARQTSIVEDIGSGTTPKGPAEDVKAVMAEKGLRGARVGIELNTYGLTAFNYQRVCRALEGWCELVDASHVVRRLRLIKAETELAYVRGAAELADNSLRAMVEAARPGAFEER